VIITRTPFRISFFGGGTDYPTYYREHGGAVLSTTINKYCYITCRYLPPFFDHRFRIRYTSREETQGISEIQHPSVRACLEFLDIQEGIEMVHTSDIPAMSGMGSSSAFTVGFLHALYALTGKIVTERQLAFEAIHVEQNIIRENVGSQDQTAAAFGGLNRIDFGVDDSITVRPLPVIPEKLQYLQDCLWLCFSGFSRYAEEVALEQIKATPHHLKELRRLHEMVDEAVEILNGDVKELNTFGELLHESWMLKRNLSRSVSNSDLDNMYEAARRAGAIGGKLCGAGGGGFFLFFVPPECREQVAIALKHLLLVPFNFETLGSHIAFYST
jgi:D-glycero-alpha-D-manno-heptose-7-phosphate kinase